MSAVTPPDVQSSKVNEESPSVTSARDKTRERVRRHRALKRQAASIEFVRTDASLFLHPDACRRRRACQSRDGFERDPTPQWEDILEQVLGSPRPTG